MQRLIKKFLSAQTASEHLSVAQVHLNVSTPTNHELIRTFLQEGKVVPPEIFNSVLEYCLPSLLTPYRSFIGTKMGESVRVNMLGEDADAEFMHVVVVLIQNQWRCYLARKRINLLLKQQAQH